MSDNPVYQASQIKRIRSTKADIEARREALHDIVEAMRPMTVRQVFYQATVRDIVEKSEAGYAKVQTDLVLMRRSGALPYGWLADNTRWQRSRAPSIASSRRWRIPPDSTASRSGRMPPAMWKSG